MLRKLVFLLLLAVSSAGHAEPLNYDAFARLPVQHEGRIKPLQTFALTHLQQISGTTQMDDQPAIAWLASVMLNPSDAIEQPLFLLKDADAQSMLELPSQPENRYRFTEVVQAIGKHQALIASLLERPASELSLGQQAVVKLYNDSGLFRQIMLSATLVLPTSHPLPPAEMKRLRLDPDASSFTDYYHALPKLQQAARSIIARKGTDSERYTPGEQQLVAAARNLTVALETSRDNTLLRVAPAQWNTGEEWLAPWAVFHSAKGSPYTAKMMEQWHVLAAAYRANDATQWLQASHALSVTMDEAPGVRPASLALEIAYYQWAPLA